MKKILFLVALFNLQTIFADLSFDKEAYAADEAKEFLLPRKYAAQMRQNCNFVLY